MDKRLTVWCHAHEGLHERKPGFFSSPLSKVVDGISYPVMACDACMAKPGNVVRAAYLRMTGAAAVRCPNGVKACVNHAKSADCLARVPWGC